MKLNNSKKKTFTEFDDEFNDYEDPEKWYEQVWTIFLIIRITAVFVVVVCCSKMKNINSPAVKLKDMLIKLFAVTVKYHIYCEILFYVKIISGNTVVSDL